MCKHTHTHAHTHTHTHTHKQDCVIAEQGKERRVGKLAAGRKKSLNPTVQRDVAG